MNQNQMTHHHLIIIQARGWSTAQDQRAACLALDTTSPDLASWLLFITTLSPCSDATSLHCTTHFLFPFSQSFVQARILCFCSNLSWSPGSSYYLPKKNIRKPSTKTTLLSLLQPAHRQAGKKKASQANTHKSETAKRNETGIKKKFKEDSEPVCHALRKRGQDLGRQTTGSKAQRQRQRQRQSGTDTTRNTNAQFGRVR
jgi:hypothetical protein